MPDKSVRPVKPAKRKFNHVDPDAVTKQVLQNKYIDSRQKLVDLKIGMSRSPEGQEAFGLDNAAQLAEQTEHVTKLEAKLEALEAMPDTSAIDKDRLTIREQQLEQEYAQWQTMAANLDLFPEQTAESTKTALDILEVALDTVREELSKIKQPLKVVDN